MKSGPSLHPKRITRQMKGHGMSQFHGKPDSTTKIWLYVASSRLTGCTYAMSLPSGEKDASFATRGNFAGHESCEPTRCTVVSVYQSKHSRPLSAPHASQSGCQLKADVMSKGKSVICRGEPSEGETVHNWTRSLSSRIRNAMRPPAGELRGQ